MTLQKDAVERKVLEQSPMDILLSASCCGESREHWGTFVIAAAPRGGNGGTCLELVRGRALALLACAEAGFLESFLPRGVFVGFCWSVGERCVALGRVRCAERSSRSARARRRSRDNRLLRTHARAQCARKRARVVRVRGDVRGSSSRVCQQCAERSGATGCGLASSSMRLAMSTSSARTSPSSERR